MQASRVPSNDSVEALTERIGEEILASLSATEETIADAEWWEEKILEWCMQHPELKVELFRFVDVLPALRPAEVTPHLLEYLGDARDDLPNLLRWSVDLTPSEGAVGRLVARAARRNVSRMARRFVAGSTTGEALAAIRRLRRERLAVTLDVLGEAVITEAEADAYLAHYVALLKETAKIANRFAEDPLIDRDHDGSPLPRVNVSLKLSALTAIFDPIDPEGTARSVLPRLKTVLDVAEEVGGFVHVDMEHYELKDLTLRLFQEVLSEPRYRHRTNVGIVLQAYLRDCERDLMALADWARTRGAPVWVRLVKGAYWDYETVIAEQRGWPVPVWQEKWESDACFERCTDLLLDRADALRPAFGSHNVRSLARAIAASRERKLPPGFIELQTLYGMADTVKRALVALGERVRVYTPYGELIPGMAYLVRRLLENTSNESFVRHKVVDERGARHLLAPPRPPPPAPKKRIHMESVRPSADFRNEPLLDFSNEAVHRQFAQSIADVKKRLGVSCPVTIEGRAVETAGRIESRSPSDTRVLVGTAGSAGAAEADRAVEVAVRHFDEWKNLSVEHRAGVLERAADLLGARRRELAAWIVFEAGKPWRDADADVAEAMDFCRFYAEQARALFSPRRVNVAGEENVTVHQPRGVTAVISPWNFPIAILGGMTAAALVTGNPVVMKPAEQTPITAHLLFTVLREAGVPDGVIAYLPGEGEVAGARLVEHPSVATIAFTGSRAVGHAIAKRAAETSTGRAGLKRVVAEMGGKNAIIVDDDADLDEAVPGVLGSAFGYAGQKCSACSRVIVVKSALEPFLARARDAAAALVVGPAEDPASAVGPLIDEEAVERVTRYRKLGQETGRVVFAAALPQSCASGTFVPPAIFSDLPPGSPLLEEEIFGPVLAVLSARDFEHALELANGTDYALTGGVYSRSPRNIDRAREAFDVGNLYVNRKITGALVGRQPFGGFRHSGMGHKAGGPDTLSAFVTARTITENTLRRGFAPE